MGMTLSFFILTDVKMCFISLYFCTLFFFFQAEDGIRDLTVTGVQTCALPISLEGNLTGVGRPDGTIVIEAVIGGELRNAAPICVHDIDILAGAAAVAIESDS